MDINPPEEENQLLDNLDTDFHIHKPTLMVRIKSSLIDVMIMILLMWIVSFFEIQSDLLRGILFVLVILYEPLFISIYRTAGQYLTGIRVLNYSRYKKTGKESRVNILLSLIRYLLKLSFGWFSLLTIHSDTYGRAIHDKAASTVVIYN